MATSEQKRGGSTPYPLALLLCDDVIVDAESKKKTLVGIFSQVLTRQFPTSQKMVIYARLIDAEGRYNLRAEYVQVKSDKKLGEGQFPELNIPNRLQTTELVLRPPPVPIPEVGEYEFRLWANDCYVGRVKFIAAQMATKEPPGKGG